MCVRVCVCELSACASECSLMCLNVICVPPLSVTPLSLLPLVCCLLLSLRSPAGQTSASARSDTRTDPADSWDTHWGERKSLDTTREEGRKKQELALTFILRKICRVALQHLTSSPTSRYGYFCSVTPLFPSTPTKTNFELHGKM